MVRINNSFGDEGMRTLKVYLHGATMGTRPSTNSHNRAKRGKVGGWSAGATRRNVAFLRSVESESLLSSPDGPLIGVAVTLTLRDCPATSADFHKLRRAFLMRMERMGMYRCHWVIEWQRRGVPHIHGALWFPMPDSPTGVAMLGELIADHWLTVAEPYGVSRRAQHLTVISDAIGWFQYVAKHAARGVSHYQRSSENIPEGWTTTGRMWGKTGDWVTRDAMQFDLSDDVYFRFRRLARSWRKADARGAGGYRIRTARQMLKCNDADLSKLRGLSEWMPQDLTLALLYIARGSGTVEQVWASDLKERSGLRSEAHPRHMYTSNMHAILETQE